MIKIRSDLKPADLLPKIVRLWEAAAPKILSIDKDDVPGQAAPVFTWDGKYTARGWTEWTQGFVCGSALLQYDATGDETFLKLGRDRMFERMAPHITHVGVHDHGFNNVSTYGNLLRLLHEGRILDAGGREKDYYELALKRERDTKISLRGRLLAHARTTAEYSVYYGEGRDYYDVRGRVAHESVFNKNNGDYRCPNSQQGFAPFTTWTRGLAWIMCGYPEELEWLTTLDAEPVPFGGRAEIGETMLKAARATCDFYLEHTPTDSIPYRDTGAPELWRLGDYPDRPAEMFNDHEPVDSSAAAIAAQGLLRLGRYLQDRGEEADGTRYFQAGLTVLDTLFDEPYLSVDPNH